MVRLNPIISVAQLAKEVKGSSSHLVTHVLQSVEFFKWQGVYGAFTIRKSEIITVKGYVENQVSHHSTKQLEPELERIHIE